MVALILFDTPPNLPFSPGFFAGWQTVTQTMELKEAQEIKRQIFGHARFA